MQKKVFIHIGAHKTGTTSLQRALHTNHESLKARGILYPRAAHFQYAQHRLAFAAKGMRDPSKGDHPDLDAELKSLRSEIDASSCRTIVISSEEFFETKEASISKIAEALSDCSVEIVAIIRRPDDLFCSIYNQKVKGPTNNFKVHYNRFLANPPSLSGDLQFEASLGRWATEFRPERIRVECYETHPDSVVLALGCMSLSPDMLVRERPAKANRSVCIKAIEIMRHAKHAAMDDITRRRVFEAAEEFMSPAPGTSESLLSPDERMSILKKMDAITDAVFTAYLKRPNSYHSSLFRAEYFPPKTTLTITDTVKLLGTLLREPV